MAEIKYVGLDELSLDAFELQKLRETAESHAQKIERLVHNQLELIVHVKSYEKAGEKQKFSLHVRANYPGGHVVSDKVHDWNILTAVQHSLKAIEEQLHHKFRV